MNDSSSSTRFKSLFDAALLNYEKQTGTTLADHPLAKQLQTCESVESITAFFQEQVSLFRDFRDHGKIVNSLKSAVSVLHSLSTNSTLRDCISASVPFPPATAILSGLALLLATIKDVSASFDALIDLLECIGKFLNRLDIYVKIPPTPAITEVVLEILVELISALALETKEVKQGRFKKFVKKIWGDNKVEHALQRFERLVQEESRASGAQALAVIYNLDRKIDILIDDGKKPTDSAQDAPDIQQNASAMNQAKREKLQQDFQNWLSPPDPWKNHNTAYESHHNGTATWFLEGNTYSEWKSSNPSSPLWINGKPGSGKSVLCSAIIEDINGMRKLGQASLAFFYCDFRDDKKKDRRELISSLLVQLCDQSDAYLDILSSFYLEHGRGSRHPGYNALLECLTRVLRVSGQPPAFVVIDALDEVPNTTGVPSPRDEVLDLLARLVNSRIPNLHICVTSRPETDIQFVLDPLSFRSISLHGESGQVQDIVEYIKSVVNTVAKMRRWKLADKDLVIRTLSEKADGMFRWVFCQLAYLRRCIPARIRKALYDLPETLDETYARVLQDIDEQSWEYAHRLFECVSVALRPLRVEELAEFLALDFDAGPIPTFEEDWQPEDPGKDVLSICSSLLSIVEVDDSQVIEFSHFSVKEYLTSDRLAKAGDDISRYHVSLTPAHATATRTCLGVLLHLDNNISRDKLTTLPLVEYAAQCLVDHARFEGVWLKTQDGMKRLFDPDGPHLAVWLWIYHPPTLYLPSGVSSSPSELSGTALHYAAFYGLDDVVKFLVIEHRQDVNALSSSGRWTPLHLASTVEVVRLLLDHGADLTARNDYEQTPLHLAQSPDAVRLLLEHGADPTARDILELTPLHSARSVDVVQLLLEHSADVTAQNKWKRTPLHNANSVEVAQLLLEHGADMTARDDYGQTPLHQVMSVDVDRLLLEHGADVSARDNDEQTPLHLAWSVGAVRLLLEHGADPTAQDKQNRTPLHNLYTAESVEVARLLLEHGADVIARDSDERTPLHEARSVGLVRLLLEYGADPAARDKHKRTPLHEVVSVGVSRLLEHGADMTAQVDNDSTSLYGASTVTVETVQLLLEHGADVTAQDNYGRTPLHLAWSVGVARLLLGHGADPTAQDEHKRTPLHDSQNVGVARLLLEHGADVAAQDKYMRTPLHDAWSVEIAQLLLDRGADPIALDEDNRTPLHSASKRGSVGLCRFLFGLSAYANTQDNIYQFLIKEAEAEEARLMNQDQ